MSGLVSVVFFFLGIIWAIAGKDVFAVLACFLIYAVLSGVWEINQLRQDLQDYKDDDMSEVYDAYKRNWRDMDDE